MDYRVIKDEKLKESYITFTHPTGLQVFLYPMKGYSTAYALFGTKYGSIDTCFKTDADADFVEIPEGVAHFLEHKLFESEEGDAFTLFAQTGASANAFTSFDKTCYLFSCADHFEESLGHLLTFVQEPYFTAQTVEKEQGIIGQEIRMYDDEPGWRVFFNLLTALYHNHPVRIDIAGTVESIAKIDDKLLYRCYNTFYNLNNMVLSIAGNFDVDKAIAIIDQKLKPAKEIQIERKTVEEPMTVLQHETVQRLEVALPLFHIGFKEKPEEGLALLKAELETEILLKVIAGSGSQLYRRLYDSGLINDAFGTEVHSGRGYFSGIFAGESKDPRKVYEEIVKEIVYFRENGLPEEDIERVKRAMYGRSIRGLNDVEDVANLLVSTYFEGVGVFDAVHLIAAVTPEDIAARFASSFDPERSAISIVEPIKE
ncbi:MAG: insulinase family protein [Oscillospiraceae bacterium]|nr:insulinase family protein [Oscillospiraceae bacterium]